jgi:hypothetical protein
VLASLNAAAQTQATAPRTDHVAPANVSVSVLIGGSNGGALLGGTVLGRIGYLDVGVEAVGAGELFGYSYSGWAADAGLGWQTASGWRFDAFGAVGVHDYSGVGSELFSSDPGASAVVPFAGARVMVSYVFGKGPGHFELGLLGLAEDDLTRETESYDYTETDSFFGGANYPEHATHTVGTSRLGAGLTLTFGSDVL